jgi:hypothetical protein
MSTCFFPAGAGNANVLVQTTSMLGFGSTGTEPSTESSQSRLINATGAAALATVVAPAGSLAMGDDGIVYLNQSGTAAWVTLGGAGPAAGGASVDSNVITDPGNTGAIFNSGIGNCPLTVAAAGETRTIANPTFVGAKVLLSLASLAAGGTVAITAGGQINAAGNTVMTFNAAGDSCILQGFNVGGAVLWRIVDNDGPVLS